MDAIPVAWIPRRNQGKARAARTKLTTGKQLTTMRGMLKLSIVRLALLAFTLAGCSGGGGGGGTSNDLSVNDLSSSANDMVRAADLHQIFSCCGQPGDTGNSLGVGKFCDTLTCPGQKANFCASLGGDPTLHFCTMACTPTDGGPDPCGENATCQCQGAQCGCYPAKCAMQSPPDGCM